MQGRYLEGDGPDSKVTWLTFTVGQKTQTNKKGGGQGQVARTKCFPHKC